MLTLHASPRWVAYIAVQLECVLTDEEPPQLLLLLETRKEPPKFVSFKTSVKNASVSETNVLLPSGILDSPTDRSHTISINIDFFMYACSL